jgi:hypothetical protein
MSNHILFPIQVDLNFPDRKPFSDLDHTGYREEITRFRAL